MIELILIALAVGGVLYFSSKDGPGLLSGGSADLDARFDSALKDIESDPFAKKVFGEIATMMTGKAPSEAEVSEAMRKTLATARTHWADKDPHMLAEDAIQSRHIGAQLLLAKTSKEPGSEIGREPGAEAFANKLLSLSSIFKEKIEALTKQGQNLDLAFKEIDAGKDPMAADGLSEKAAASVEFIDKAALSPLVFVPTDEGLTKGEGDAFSHLFGKLVTLKGDVVGNANITYARPIGKIDGQNMAVGVVDYFTISAGSPPAGYFGNGTNIYISSSTSLGY